MKRDAKPTLLLVDDDPAIREILRANLETDGFVVAEAADGNEAWLVASLMVPDVIVLDLMLPGRHGLDVLAELRRTPGLRHVPVLVLSASARPSDVIAAHRAGADRVMTKPFGVDRLVQELFQLV